MGRALYIAFKLEVCHSALLNIAGLCTELYEFHLHLPAMKPQTIFPHHVLRVLARFDIENGVTFLTRDAGISRSSEKSMLCALAEPEPTIQTWSTVATHY